METLNGGDVKAALLQLQEIAKANEELPPGEVMLALVYATAGQVPYIRKYLEDAVDAYPNDPAAYMLMANLAIKESRKTEAELLLAKSENLISAYEGHPKRKKDMRIRYLSGRATLAEKSQKWEQANQYFAEWLKLDEKNASLRYQFAHTLARLGKWDAAFPELKKAYAANDKLPVPPVAVAQFFNEMKDKKNTAKWFAYAEKKFPQNVTVHLAAAKWQWGSRQRG